MSTYHYQSRKVLEKNAYIKTINAIYKNATKLLSKHKSAKSFQPRSFNLNFLLL